MPRGRRMIQFSKLYSFSCIRSSFKDVHAKIGDRGYYRVVYYNDPDNSEALQLKYRGNYVSTTKYMAANFIPKSLFEQFKRVANIYFLVVAIVSFSPLAPFKAVSVLILLLVVIGATMVKEAIEDWRRRKQCSVKNVEFSRLGIMIFKCKALFLYIFFFLGVFLAPTPAYAEIVLNLPYKLFGKCMRSPLNITPVNASGFVQSHSWFREKDSSLVQL